VARHVGDCQKRVLLTLPLVTVVTPSYNQGEFIRATIESVLSQSYPQIEYIVMDGGSTDQTAAIVAEYAGRLTWISEKDRGQAHAINKGFIRARGEIVAWLNSDDLLLPGAVAHAVEAFNAAPAAGAIYGEGYLIDRDGRSKGRFHATEPLNLWKLVYLSDYILQQSTFFRRSALEEIGWLDENLHYTLDWDLLIRLGLRFQLHYTPEYLGVLREYSDAKTFSGGGRRIEEIRQILERHTGLKRAPGYWTYGLDNIQRRTEAFLLERSPWWLQLPARVLTALIRLGTRGTIIYILRHAQGLYSDSWASNRLNWMLPHGSGDVVVRGVLPDHPRLHGSVLSVLVANEKQLGSFALQPGDFEVRFRAPDGPGPFAFQLRASRYLWGDVVREKSVRKLAFILKSADWADNHA